MATAIDRRQVEQWLTEGFSLRQIAQRLGLPLTTFWRHWQRLQHEAAPPVHADVNIPAASAAAAPLSEQTAVALQALLVGQQALQDELAHQRAALDTLRAEVEALRLAPPSPPEPGGRIRQRLRVPGMHAAAETREPCTVRLLPSLWEAAMEAAAQLGQPHNHFVEDALRAHLRQIEAAPPAAP